MIIEGDDIFGDGVNITARLEALAEPGGICISRTVRDNIRDKLPYAFDDMGERSVKNIARPLRTYALGMIEVAALRPVTVRAQPKPPPRQRRPRRLAAPPLSMVVLPFANLSSDPDQEYFADGITEDLTTDLSGLSGSFVISRNTALTYRGKPVDVKQLGRELGVRYVIEGSVRRTGEEVRVNVQLIDAESGAHLWADRFETDRRNLAEAQSEITGRLARTLNLELVGAAGRRIEQERAVDPDARDLVMRGSAWLYRSGSPDEEAQRFFERALEIDPRSVEAKIGLARVLIDLIANGRSNSPQQDGARGEQLLLEALERDPNSSLAHNAMGQLRMTQNRLAEARIEFERTITLDRNNSTAFRRLGYTTMFLGQPETAIPLFEKAIWLNPHSTDIAYTYFGLGGARLLLGQFAEGIDLLRKSRAANPRIFLVALWLAGALGLRGDLDEARALVAEAAKLKPEVNSLAGIRTQFPWIWGNPQYLALSEKTWMAGLCRAGFPEE